MTSCSCNAQPSHTLVEYILRMDALLGFWEWGNGRTAGPQRPPKYCQQWLAVVQTRDRGRRPVSPR
jgi:hypothetical protein